MKKLTITITDKETIELLEREQDLLTKKRVQTGLLRKERQQQKIPFPKVLKSILKGE